MLDPGTSGLRLKEKRVCHEGEMGGKFGARTELSLHGGEALPGTHSHWLPQALPPRDQP